MKKLVFACVCMLAMLFFFSTKDVTAGSIPQGWHVCQVKTVGPFFGESLMTVECEGVTGVHWVVFDTAVKRELLATALTASSSGQNVRAWVHANTRQVSSIHPQILYSLMIRPD